MLNPDTQDPRSNDIIIRSLTHDPDTYALALGCAPCSLRGTCGGLCVKASLVDCLDLCCGKPSGCTRVCRNRPDAFVDQVREIDGFQLRRVPRAPALPVGFQQNVVPLIYHGSRRASALSYSIFALRLPDLVNFSTGGLRFKTRTELCAAFRIDPSAEIILTGVNLDGRIESWWSLGQTKRLLLIKSMVAMGIKMVTAPNFSVVLDHPRFDDMHAMKRIGLLFSEFQLNGMPCALHPNGRTETDFERWGRFIATREEVRVLAYEFITGPARKERRQFHLDQLTILAGKAGRDLDIIIRGDPRVIPVLRKSFKKVVYIETTSFMKSIKRQRAVRKLNDALVWAQTPTEIGETIDALFTHNLQERILLLNSQFYDGFDALSEVA